MLDTKTIKLLLIIGFWTTLLIGCREEERDRYVYYEPGVYKGKLDKELSDKMRKSLRQRTIFQGSGMTSMGGNMLNRNVRGPEKKDSVSQALKNRIRLQGDGKIK